LTHFTVISLLFLMAGLVFCALGVRKLIRRQLLNAAVLELSGLGLLAVAGLLFLVASNLYTYQRLVYESPVAEIAFEQIAPSKFSVVLRMPESGKLMRYELLGDEWQLDAQILSWRGYANLLGLDPYYRLHRLSGRYTSIEQERTQEHSVHALAVERSFDFWQLVHEYHEWVQLVDAMYGSAVFLPMTDQAEYSISISRNGLVARPDNAVAKKAVSRWIGL
jgi:hypothetical protein